jgi:hypothetical protein
MAKEHSYIPITNEEEDGLSAQQAVGCQRLRWALGTLFFVVGMITMLGIGYTLGARQTNIVERPTISMLQHQNVTTFFNQWIVPPGDQHYYMHFNATFAQRSNTESDSAWDSLFPDKLGFVQHPVLAPNVAGIAVFHELHCLVRKNLEHP